MADNLRPRLDRLQELSKTVNARTDEAGKIIQGIETYLNDVLHVGFPASIRIDFDQDWQDQYWLEQRLAYARWGEKFRLFVIEHKEIDNAVDDHKETLWANCTRDVKLLAFNALPALLDELIKTLEGTLEQLKVNSETLQAILPPPKAKAAKA